MADTRLRLNVKNTRFSVVIVHRNGADMLSQTLAALLTACDARLDEVIVVDNGSQDNSLVRLGLDYPNVRVIANGCNRGFAAACNQGLSEARGRFALLLNNDATLPADALSMFEEDFQRWPRAALIGGQLIGPDGHMQRSVGVAPDLWSEMGVRSRRPLAVGPDSCPVAVETLVGACMAVRLEAVEEVGPLDEDFFFYFEETEWCVRLRRRGWLVLCDPRVRIGHLKGASTRPLRRGAQVEMFRSRLLYYRKTLPWSQAYWLVFWRVLRLVMNTLSHGVLVVLTLGLAARVREKLAVYLTLLAWLLLGAPRHWGLPDKCPSSG